MPVDVGSEVVGARHKGPGAIRFAMIVGGCHDDTCKNKEDAHSLSKCHGFSMSSPIKDHATKPSSFSKSLIIQNI